MREASTVLLQIMELAVLYWTICSEHTSTVHMIVSEVGSEGTVLLLEQRGRIEVPCRNVYPDRCPVHTTDDREMDQRQENLVDLYFSASSSIDRLVQCAAEDRDSSQQKLEQFRLLDELGACSVTRLDQKSHA
ncbi:hypothetical protein F5880DRAFT_1618589 [Lentinula raphanica]|nr:hypothetical protein F5880DRAFT_1618589 [Lentinula raphanica]